MLPMPWLMGSCGKFCLAPPLMSPMLVSWMDAGGAPVLASMPPMVPNLGMLSGPSAAPFWLPSWELCGRKKGLTMLHIMVLQLWEPELTADHRVLHTSLLLRHRFQCWGCVALGTPDSDSEACKRRGATIGGVYLKEQ